MNKLQDKIKELCATIDELADQVEAKDILFKTEMVDKDIRRMATTTTKITILKNVTLREDDYKF